jgi:hypothetical protein
MRSRTWWRNLSAGLPARLRYQGRTFPVRAEVITDPALVKSGLEAYFRQYPAYAKYFNLTFGADGLPDEQGMNCLTNERLIIHLYPIP